MNLEHGIAKGRQIHLKALDIGASADTIAQEYRVLVNSPYSKHSVVRPEAVDLQVLTWENPLPRRPSDVDPNAYIQVVVIGGFAINTVELGSEITELLKYSNKIVGIAHPDAPQSKITPRTSPFNDFYTFQNSGTPYMKRSKRSCTRAFWMADAPSRSWAFPRARQSPRKLWQQM